MTRKTVAAKHFAETYGVYTNADNRYSLSPRYTVYSDYDSRRADSLEEQVKQHQADLRVVMALLGVEEQYEDTISDQDVHYLFGDGPRFVVTKTAVQKFAEDLRAAQSAIDGEAALKRLRKAVKTVKKESE